MEIVNDDPSSAKNHFDTIWNAARPAKRIGRHRRSTAALTQLVDEDSLV
jgi:hypothetical protein